MDLRVVMLLNALLQLKTRRWGKYFDLTKRMLAYQVGTKKIAPKCGS
jgi:hypothetical protein